MKTTLCRLCGTPTPMLGTKLCDRCWELEGRIEMDFALALKIVERIKNDISLKEMNSENR